MKKALFLLLLLLISNTIAFVLAANAQQAPYQDIQVPVSESNKSFSEYYIIASFGSAIAFLATMYVRKENELNAEKDKSLNREIERNREEKQHGISLDQGLQAILSKQQVLLQSILDAMKKIDENLTYLNRNGLNKPKQHDTSGN